LYFGTINLTLYLESTLGGGAGEVSLGAEDALQRQLQ
jgi:hypothetical protein